MMQPLRRPFSQSSILDKDFCEFVTMFRNCIVILIEVSGYNPPGFVMDAAKDAIDKVECNQYSPTKVCDHPHILMAN